MTAEQKKALREARLEAFGVLRVIRMTANHPAANTDYDRRQLIDWATSGFQNVLNKLRVVAGEKGA